MAQLEFVGYMAGALIASSLFPQIYKTYKTKSTKDISLAWTLILMSGLVCWMIYGFVNKIVPLSLFAFIEFLMALTLCTFKLKYK
jgi:MtN3 and saliva related transmembrane protein